jgi:O-succinylbenzoic acid--CoA ligase
MIVQFEKCELKIDEIHKEEFSKKSFATHEYLIIKLIQKWLNNEQNFEFKTSGSTGKAKTILIDRKKIEYSCETTMNKLDPDHKFRSALLCINPEMIGGAMVIFRSLLRNLNLKVIKPSSTPFDGLDKTSFYDLVSLVPAQLNTDPEYLNRFRTILIGGAGYNGQQPNTTSKMYSTFGMTETVSHIALRDLSTDYFECIGDLELKKRKDNRLEISGTITNNNHLITNDLIEFISSKKFRWLGRSDFVINSGGIKINPEEVESNLLIDRAERFIVSSLEDDKLGDKVILIIEGPKREIELDYSNIEKYKRPKEIHFLSNFAITPSLKIDRINTRELLVKKLNNKYSD